MKLTRVRFLSVKMVIAITLAMLLSFLLNAHVMAQSSQIQGPRDNAQVFSGVVYGPIDQTDTLWRIASRYKQDTRFSVYQVMLAIYELNPQAFENGNFNTMVNGATLRLPSDRYIARADVQQARAKAEEDDRLFGRQNSVQAPALQAGGPSTTNNQGPTDPPINSSPNLKPAVPLVNQEDLSKTQNQLQSQLNVLQRQQQQQFEALKNQVAASISSVQILLDENRKLSTQLLQIDENNRNLTQTVETELQVQIDQQVSQLNQLIDLVKQAEQRRIDEDSKSIVSLLSSNTAIILISSTLTLLTLIGFGIFLLRRPGTSNAPAKSSADGSNNSDDIVDDELVIGQIDGEIDQDSDDLLAALEQDTASQDDDILSDDLEDDDAISSLSQDEFGSDFDMDDDLGSDLAAGLGSDLDARLNHELDLGDMDDDMLVPDSSESSVGNASNEEHDIDATSLEDDEASDGGSLDQESRADQAESHNIEEIDLSDDPEATSDELKPETADNPFDPDEDDGTPQGLKLDDNGDVDEDTLDQIERKIAEKDQTISQLADELLEELDATPSSEDEAISAVQPIGEQEQTVGEADINALLAGVDDPIEQDINDETIEDEISGLSDELLAELEEESEAQNELDHLLESDDLSAIDPHDDVLDLSGNEDDLNSGFDEQEDDLPLADAPASSQINHDPSDASDLRKSELDDAKTIDMDDLDANLQAPDEQVSALANELLQELESENGTIDELESSLDELDNEPELTIEEEPELSIEDTLATEAQATADQKIKNDLNADDLLNDIPSFTSNLSGEDEENEVDDADILSEDTLAVDEQIPANVDSVIRSELDIDVGTGPASEEKSAPEDDLDVLASLPGLDDWLDEEEPIVEDSLSPKRDEEYDRQKKVSTDGEIDSALDLSALELDDIELDASFDTETSDEDALIQGLDDANFDDMLSELASESDASFDTNTNTNAYTDRQIDVNSDVKFAQESTSENSRRSDDAPRSNDASSNAAIPSGEMPNDQLRDAGLDLEALMTEDDKLDFSQSADVSPSDGVPIEDRNLQDAFVDVNDLLKDSDAMPEMKDSELDLDLERSLDQFVSNRQTDKNHSSDIMSDVENDQASNLDLAQVYIDMEDLEAAQELLDDVKRKGTEQQKSEADSLIASYKA